MRALDINLAPDSLTAETFVAADKEWVTSIQSYPNDEELLYQFTIKNTSNNDVEMIDDENDEMESTVKKQPSKKVLLEVTDLIESFAIFHDINKQL